MGLAEFTAEDSLPTDFRLICGICMPQRKADLKRQAARAVGGELAEARSESG